MYCPNCAVENEEASVKYCRGCGKDLRLISQAMTANIGWTTIAASRLDAFFLSRHQRIERESMREGGSLVAFGMILVGMGVWNLIDKPGLYFSVFLFFIALIMLCSGIGNIWVDKRSRSGGFDPTLDRLPDDLSIYSHTASPTLEQTRLHPAKSTGEIRRRNSAQLVSPPSITEHTTRHLKTSD